MPDLDSKVFEAEVHRVESFSTKTRLVNHGEDHGYQGVLVSTRVTRFHLSLPSEFDFLEYILEFDISEWTDTADPRLEAQFKLVCEQFIQKCHEVRAGDVIQIAYSPRLRRERVLAELGENTYGEHRLPLLYHPFGFETHTSEYTRREVTSRPETLDVRTLRST